MHAFNLVFLVAGMLVGVDGPIGVSFNNAQLSAWVGNAALAVILLEGGISTRMQIFRAGFRPALFAVEGDGIDRQGAHFRVIALHEGRIARVGLALAPKAVPAS